LPASGAKLRLDDVLRDDAGNRVKELDVAGSGGKSIRLSADRSYTVELVINLQSRANGTCCPSEIDATSYLVVEP
jgi:hypothetical protein